MHDKQNDGGQNNLKTIILPSIILPNLEFALRCKMQSISGVTNTPFCRIGYTADYSTRRVHPVSPRVC